MKCFNADAIVTVGNYDGVHLGHQAILRSMLSEKKAEGGKVVVLSFSPHPIFVLAPDKQVSLIYDEDEKREALESMGVDLLIQQKFDRAFASISAEAFFNEILVDQLRMKSLHVGYDFKFGKGKSGTVELLQRWCHDSEIHFVRHSPVIVDGFPCSSTRIRECLATGDVRKAAELLGRLFSYQGIVVKGNQRGRQIGFPTANLKINPKITLPLGVYATQTTHAGKTYRSVTNIGRRPTFHGADEEVPVAIETHILGFSEEIYGETIRVEFFSRIRAEKKFESVDDLINQINLDVQRVAAERYS